MPLRYTVSANNPMGDELHPETNTNQTPIAAVSTRVIMSFSLSCWKGLTLLNYVFVNAVDEKLIPFPYLFKNTLVQKEGPETVLYLRFNIRVLTKCHP